MMQEILMYGAVVAAAAFLGWRWFGRRQSKKKDCGPDCGCG